MGGAAARGWPQPTAEPVARAPNAWPHGPLSGLCTPCQRGQPSPATRVELLPRLAGAKGAGKKGKKPEGAGAEPPKGQAPPAPAASRALPSKAQDEAAAGAAALSNSVGALQHLSMLDEGKERLVAAPGGAAQLAQLLRAAGASAPAAWDAALGALWNMSLLAGADQALAEAGAPAFLCTAPRAMRLPSQPGGA